MKIIIVQFSSILLIFSLACTHLSAQKLDELKYEGEGFKPSENVIKNEVQFNGFTNYWHNTYTNWSSYGNLFKMATLDVEKTILQNKVDVAEDMGIPGLIMQEGFINDLISSPYKVLEQPERDALQKLVKKGNLLVYLNPETSLGKELTANFSGMDSWVEELKSHQYGAVDLKRIDAFVLQNGDKKLFVVSSSDSETLDKFKELLKSTENVIQKYNFHKGWFAVETLLKSVTCTKGHPLDVIGAGMNEGNSWFVFSGYMDFLAKNELENWMNDVSLPIVTDVGFSPIFGCNDYDGFQDRLMLTKDAWNNYAKKKSGYVFRNVWDTFADPFVYDGYFAIEGNKVQIDNEDVPFVLRTGRLDQNATSSMVLFIEKGKEFTRETMWEAILDRREVGILEQGKMMGPAKFRNALQMLLLDREFLIDYFGDNISINTEIVGYDLQVTVTNNSQKSISGNLELNLPEALNVELNSAVSIDLSSKKSGTQSFNLQPGSSAMDNTNPVAIKFKWNGKEKSIVAMLDLPPAISVHQLLYGHSPKINYPVTIHNFTNQSSFPVNIKVIETDNQNNVVYETSQTCNTETATFKDMHFELEIPAGNYNVKISALGVETTSQLGVGKAEGAPYAYEIDINNDGVTEYRMENDSVQITLLATGARVIEYIVKSRNDNVLFKLWPEKTGDDKEPFRERGFYPYGGFEDFLGQGSMENHQVYNAEIVKSEGDFVRVRMWTDYFGNRFEKTFTLYGNSPLLEVRFALTFKNPEANVLGPQPILALGDRHWTEDVFTVPELDGLHEYRMRPEKRYGMVFHLKEGWNAGYDTKQDITFVGAYPVNQLLFLHMFLNEPGNHSSHYFYGEFQPWIPIFQRSTMYFTYYLWGAGGAWQNGVDDLRQKNLITTK